MRVTLLLAWAAAACTPAASADGPRLKLDSEVVWSHSWEHFGGFSGLEVLDGGNEVLAISDRGRWVRGTMHRTDGTLTAVEGADRRQRGRLKQITGEPVRSDTYDAEGLAMDPEGRAYVSFEGFDRIRRYDNINGPAAWMPEHPDFEKLQSNSGLEALAIDAEGTIYTIPERSGELDRPFPVYRLRDGSWDTDLKVRRDGTFLVSDATFGPDGKLYVLERDFTWLGGFSTRVRRFTLGPDGLDGEVTLLQTRVGELDNMEGISVWRDPQGQIRVTLLSDDNFMVLQRTMFAEYLLVGE